MKLFITFWGCVKDVQKDTHDASRSRWWCPMSIPVIEISSSDEDGEEEYEEKVKIKVMANRSTRRASSAAEQYSSWRSRRVEKLWEEDEDEDEEDEEEDDDDDCFILPSNPFLGDQLDLSLRLSLDSPPPPDDVAIIAERGKVLFPLSINPRK